MSSTPSNFAAPIVSKLYCSSSPLLFMVRNRPLLVNGGGFVVTNSGQEVVFRAEGCATLGTKGKLLLRDGHGASLLRIRQKGGVVQALIACGREWKGYTTVDEDAEDQLVFCLKQPSSWALNSKVTVSVAPAATHSRDWDFQVKGSFVDRDCCICDRRGNVVAQVGVVDVKELVRSKDVYHVLVHPGTDQAFVFGVIAVLDNIYGQSTAC